MYRNCLNVFPEITPKFPPLEVIDQRRTKSVIFRSNKA